MDSNVCKNYFDIRCADVDEITDFLGKDETLNINNFIKNFLRIMNFFILFKHILVFVYLFFLQINRPYVY